MSTAIATMNLRVDFGQTVAIRDLSIGVPARSSLAVIGPNGSGKSTLLSVIAGTREPTAGSVEVYGQAAALVLQSTDVDKSLPITVEDTVGIGRYASLGMFQRFGRADRDAVERSMHRLGITDLARRQLHELSGGQRQRAFVAQGIAQVADVLLLDEPVTGLDMSSRQVILDLIDEEVDDGKTVVVTTHSLDEARRCDLVLLLDTVAIAFGTPDEVLTETHLRRAFGGHFLQVGDDIILDDPHHSH
ncbi:MAG: zinc ABC transporter ATP-binding protein AztA [Acidimicrobiales bacterium]|nr:metal ABC transporter ATP-binding protein [Acidimicrobiaceae bacterium]MDG1087119.1 zinc ABC transporter ATP-binding protein AztA [Acidimicrobiales bacterium]